MGFRVPHRLSAAVIAVVAVVGLASAVPEAVTDGAGSVSAENSGAHESSSAPANLSPLPPRARLR